MEPPITEVEKLHSQVADLKAELDSLRARYDTLLEAKNRAAEHYKADFKKWRAFKEWIFPDAETEDHVKSLLKSGEFCAYIRASALGKRKQLEESGPDREHAVGDRGPKSLKQESQATHDMKVDPPSPSAAAVSQPRKSYHGESSHSILSLSGNIASFLPPLSTNLDDDKASVLDASIETPCKAELSRPGSSTVPRKGRGRYAQVPSGMDTINSRFSIRKDRNDGLDFQYDAVVRNRDERKHMLGSDCECCREYYKAVGPLPPSRQPLWRTPTKRKAFDKPHVSDDDKENTDEAEEHKQLISRHRHHWHRPKTPPGYWDIGFPDTQEVLDINRRAAEMHQRKLFKVEAEARNDGRYIEHAPKSRRPTLSTS